MNPRCSRLPGRTKAHMTAEPIHKSALWSFQTQLSKHEEPSEGRLASSVYWGDWSRLNWYYTSQEKRKALSWLPAEERRHQSRAKATADWNNTRAHNNTMCSRVISVSIRRTSCSQCRCKMWFKKPPSLATLLRRRKNIIRRSRCLWMCKFQQDTTHTWKEQPVAMCNPIDSIQLPIYCSCKIPYGFFIKPLWVWCRWPVYCLQILCRYMKPIWLEAGQEALEHQ